MILKNSKGKERKFKLLMEIERNNQKYYIYEDNMTNKVYGGLKDQEKLKNLDEKEIKYLENMLEKIEE